MSRGLSANQLASLNALAAAGAVSAETGMTVEGGKISPGAIGGLRRKGLADKAPGPPTDGYGERMLYFLTPAGVERARVG